MNSIRPSEAIAYRRAGFDFLLFVVAFAVAAATMLIAAPKAHALSVCHVYQTKTMDLTKAWTITAFGEGWCKGGDVARHWEHICVQRRHVRNNLPDQWFCVIPSNAGKPHPSDGHKYAIDNTVDCASRDAGGYYSKPGQARKYRTKVQMTVESVKGERYVTIHINKDRERTKVCGASKPGSSAKSIVPSGRAGGTRTFGK